MTRVFDEDLAAGFATRAIHAGQRPEPLAGAIMTPVYLTSTYVQDGARRKQGVRVRARQEPDARGARAQRRVARRWASRIRVRQRHGMPRLDHEAVPRRRSHRVRRERVRRHVPPVRQDPPAFRPARSPTSTRAIPQRVADAMTPATRAVLVETPTNPMMRLTDLAAVAEIAHRARAPCSSSTTRSRRRTSSGRSSSAPTSSTTRRRST